MSTTTKPSSKTFKLQYPHKNVMERPTFLTIEDHSQIKLKDALSDISHSSEFKEYLSIGIINQSELLKWKHEQAMTILDKEDISSEQSDVAMPKPGTILEKMYANKKSTPVEYRRNREWTDYNWRRQDEWKQFYTMKKVSNVRRDCVRTRNEEAIYRQLNE